MSESEKKKRLRFYISFIQPRQMAQEFSVYYYNCFFLFMLIFE